MPPLLQCIFLITLGTIGLASIYMATQFRAVKRMDEGTVEMSATAAKIRFGSKVFTKAIYRYIIIVGAVLTGILIFTIEPGAGIAYAGGIACTTVAALIGMTVATLTNVRAAATALKNQNEKESIATARTVNTTIKGSQICGIAVPAANLLGLTAVIIISGWGSFSAGEGDLIIPIVARLTAYGLGWSTLAMFCRVAGGIFTKAGDIGADLIGKVFMHFDEDDPRNPAVLADQVGDNVNDIMANMADLGESFGATPITTIICAINMWGNNDNELMLVFAIVYPFVLALGGLISAIIGLFYASHAKESEDPSKQLNISMYIAAGGTLITSLIASWFLFKKGITPDEFTLGWISPFLSTVCGILAGVGVGLIAQYYTDLNSKWAKRTAKTAKNGSAICASMSQAGGWISILPEIGVIYAFSIIASIIAGPYGGAVMALGMLAFVAQPIGADAFGPISDNAGGIAECSKLPPKVRRITDKNDATGNTTAAMGKAFAIGSAAAVVNAQLRSYAMAYGASEINILQNNVWLGAAIGAGLIAAFCGLLGLYTIKAANEMAAEVRRQLLDPDVVAGKKEPDSNICIHIATVGSVKKMVVPVLIPICATVSIGFLFGPAALGGTLASVALFGVPLAIYFSNAGGLADNVKKRFEAALEDVVKGMPEYDLAHDAAVVGDTIGDWFKDVVAVSIDIFMKIMGTLAVMLAPLFAQMQVFPNF